MGRLLRSSCGAASIHDHMLLVDDDCVQSNLVPCTATLQDCEPRIRPVYELGLVYEARTEARTERPVVRASHSLVYEPRTVES